MAFGSVSRSIQCLSKAKHTLIQWNLISYVFLEMIIELRLLSVYLNIFSGTDRPKLETKDNEGFRSNSVTMRTVMRKSHQ